MLIYVSIKFEPIHFDLSKSVNNEGFFSNQIQVRNIWLLSPLILSKSENLASSVCILFEESVFIFLIFEG